MEIGTGSADTYFTYFLVYKNNPSSSAKYSSRICDEAILKGETCFCFRNPSNPPTATARRFDVFHLSRSDRVNIFTFFEVAKAVKFIKVGNFPLKRFICPTELELCGKGLLTS